MSTKITITKENEGEYIGVAGDNYRIVVSGKETNGAYAVIEMLVPPGGGPIPHKHPKIHETFFIVEGELLFKTEEGQSLVKQGGFVDIPFNGGAHAFVNQTDKNCRMICTVAPAGLDDFFKEFGEPVKPNEFLPQPKLTPDFMKKLDTLNEKYGQIMFPPDYLD
ncbi:cupin domain-containing protein [Tenacibaculum singaporense]|uniref:cupin domain-containing protein n=1 Tax=Tenacibaculum singaporense TaxID=2358479 RepID=UPI000F668EFB|nr:cupin domain-containing protein [Tenacibaculum singaporense]RSC93477.1 cupin domain-containing protein [Tenacibaculum singaporense]